MKTADQEMPDKPMDEIRPSQARWESPILSILAGALVIVRLATAQLTFSPAIDESSYVGSSVSMIEAHKLIAPGQHPPLVRFVIAVPLWLDGARLPQCRGQTQIGGEDLGYKLGTQLLYDGPAPFDVLLRHARLAILIFPAITLLYLYLLGRMLGGQWLALAAVVFFSVDPTFLGQGLWLGADVAGCAGFLAGYYHGLRWIRGGTWKQATAAGIAIGLAFSAKFSCFFLIPALALVTIGASVQWKKLAKQVGLILPIIFFTLWATYLFNVGPLSDQEGLTGPTAHLSPDALALRQRWERLPRFVRETPLPMPSFFLAVARLVSHGSSGHLAYLNGQVSQRGWWYYFPEVFAIKSTIGFLLALVAALCIARWRTWSTRLTLIPAGVVFATAMAGHIDIGVRHILPAIPFLYLFVCQTLLRPRWAWLLSCMICASAIETALIHPDYLSFFNIAVGGPTHGANYALDSNLDWNQDVIRLSDFLENHPSFREYAVRLSGERNRPLLSALGLDPYSLTAPLHSGLLFISENVRRMNGEYAWLSRHQPIAHIGYSIDVYKLSSPAPPDEPEDHPPPDEPSGQSLNGGPG